MTQISGGFAGDIGDDLWRYVYGVEGEGNPGKTLAVGTHYKALVEGYGAESLVIVGRVRSQAATGTVTISAHYITPSVWKEVGSDSARSALKCGAFNGSSFGGTGAAFFSMGGGARTQTGNNWYDASLRGRPMPLVVLEIVVANFDATLDIEYCWHVGSA